MKVPKKEDFANEEWLICLFPFVCFFCFYGPTQETDIIIFHTSLSNISRFNSSTVNPLSGFQSPGLILITDQNNGSDTGSRPESGPSPTVVAWKNGVSLIAVICHLWKVAVKRATLDADYLFP